MTRARDLRDRIVAEVDATGFGGHGLHVLAGDDVAEHRWTPDVREDIRSVAKGVCVLAAGIVRADGAVCIDEPIGTYVPEMALGAGVEEVTLRHLLTMTSGIDLPWSATMLTDWPDLAREFFSRPSSGRVFQYSDASTYAAMTVLASQVGDVGDFVATRILAPLGIPDAVWERCPHGRIAAGGGLLLRTEELARVGRLIRDRGRWNGDEIVPGAWIDGMHSAWVATGMGRGYERYALAGWDGPGDAWRLHGSGGQLVIFVDDTVVTITAGDHFGADAIAAFAVEAARTR